MNCEVSCALILHVGAGEVARSQVDKVGTDISNKPLCTVPSPRKLCLWKMAASSSLSFRF